MGVGERVAVGVRVIVGVRVMVGVRVVSSVGVKVCVGSGVGVRVGVGVYCWFNICGGGNSSVALAEKNPESDPGRSSKLRPKMKSAVSRTIKMIRKTLGMIRQFIQVNNQPVL